MALKRYTQESSMGVPRMDECGDGEWVLLDDVIKLLEPHRITGKSVGGFLGVCSCGESIDDYQLHLIALIKGETK